MKTFQQWCASIGRTYAHGSLAERAWDAAVSESLIAFREGQRKRQAVAVHTQEQPGEHPAITRLMELSHELWDDGLDQAAKTIESSCKELSILLPMPLPPPPERP